MEAVVLAGGYATRLWPITKERPKMLLPLGESCIIDRTLSELEADDRITEVYVSTNEKFADRFRAHLSEAPFEKPTVSVEPTQAEREKQGVVWALAELVEREDVGDDLLVIAGDNLISFDLGDFVNVFEENAAPTLAAYDVGSRERARSYGLVELEGDRVVSFQEKPDDPQSTLVSIACYGFPARTLDRLEEYLEAGNNPDEPGWFLDWLHTRTPVYAYTFDEAWFDVGTPASYLDASRWILDGDSHVAPSATTDGCTLGENVHVMGGAEIHDAEVRNAIVFPESEIEDCTIRHSILDEASRVAGVDLDRAVLSRETEIVRFD